MPTPEMTTRRRGFELLLIAEIALRERICPDENALEEGSLRQDETGKATAKDRDAPAKQHKIRPTEPESGA